MHWTLEMAYLWTQMSEWGSPEFLRSFSDWRLGDEDIKRVLGDMSWPVSMWWKQSSDRSRVYTLRAASSCRNTPQWILLKIYCCCVHVWAENLPLHCLCVKGKLWRESRPNSLVMSKKRLKYSPFSAGSRVPPHMNPPLITSLSFFIICPVVFVFPAN